MLVFTVKESQDAEEEYLIRFSINDSTEDKRIGPYIIGNLIAEGSFGSVKEAFHTRTKEKVAIKILKKDLQSSDRFSAVRELDILRSLDHPNIVKLLDAFETKEKLYIVTEFINGSSLNSVINESLDYARAKRLFKQVVSAIRYCHCQDIFHRDIKPRYTIAGNSL